MEKTLEGLHFFRKVPRDLTRGTAKGGVISLGCVVLMAVLLFIEFRNFFHTSLITEVALEDEWTSRLKLPITFNITMHHVPCKFLTMDWVDHDGLERENVTDYTAWTLTHIDTNMKRAAEYHADEEDEDLLTDSLTDKDFHYPGLDNSKPGVGEQEEGPEKKRFRPRKMTAAADFHKTLKKSKFAAVTFFSVVADCELSQMWLDGWARTEQAVHAASLPGEVNFVSINCTQGKLEKELCRNHGIVGSPAIRVYHGDVDMEDGYLPDESNKISQMPTQHTVPDAVKSSTKEFQGHRMVDVVAQWIIAERTVSSENNELDEVSHDVGNHVPGCEVAGQILVSRAPGNVHFSAHSHHHTFDASVLNASHTINTLTFGGVANEDQRNAIASLPEEEKIVMDPLNGKIFSTHVESESVQHYIKIVATSFDVKTSWSKSLVKALNLFNFIPRKLFMSGTGSDRQPLSKLQRKLEAQARKEGVASFNQSTHDAFSFQDGFFKGRHMFDLARHVFGRASNMVHQYASTDVRYKEEEELPSAKFSFDLSPLVLQVKRVQTSKYIFNSFWVSLCALIGGVFTITSVFDSLLHGFCDQLERKPILLNIK